MNRLFVVVLASKLVEDFNRAMVQILYLDQHPGVFFLEW